MDTWRRGWMIAQYDLRVPDEDKAPKPVADDEVGLTRVERGVSGFLGLAGLGAGGLAVFWSENQAGTTAILLLGAVFMLMSVQGTAIIKASKDSVEMARKRASRRTLEKAKDTLDVDGPEEAKAVIEGAVAARPELDANQDLQDFRVELYITEVVDAIGRAWDAQAYNDSIRVFASGPELPGRWFFAAFGSMPNRWIQVIVIPSWYSTHRLRREIDRAPRNDAMPTLFVTQAQITATAIEKSMSPELLERVIFIRLYRNDYDLNRLTGALVGLHGYMKSLPQD